MTDPREQMFSRLLNDAGIAPGMRILDVGSGHGNVSLVLAKLVGERGQIIGIDRDASALAIARDRVHQAGLTNVTFLEGDLSALPPELTDLDAAVGRRVLMYLPDPIDVLRRIAGALKPGGIAVFQEQDATMVPVSMAPMPLHAQVHTWIWQTVEREGANLHMGFDLPKVLTASGLTLEEVRAEALVQTPHMAYPPTAIVRAVLPRILERGVATAEAIDIDTLDDRLTAERHSANSTWVSDMVFGAWARKPT